MEVLRWIAAAPFLVLLGLIGALCAVLILAAVLVVIPLAFLAVWPLEKLGIELPDAIARVTWTDRPMYPGQR